MISNGIKQYSSIKTRFEVYGLFEGGGVRGTALVGAVAAIEKQDISFRGVAGTSAGAIVASLIAAGYNAEEMLNMMLDKDFQAFRDPVSRIPFLRHLTAWRKQGLYKGDEFHRWIEEKLSLKLTGRRNKSPKFKDLPIPLTVIAADISRQEIIKFSEKNYPDIAVADAVRMSMSIPGFFCPVQFGKSLMVDGGIVSNFPTWAFEEYQKENRLPILGMRLEPDDQASLKIKGMLNLGRHIVNTTISVNTKLQMANVQDLYTIYLPTLGIDVTDFGISNQNKERLYITGHDKMQSFFTSSLGLELKERLVQLFPKR